MSSYRPGGFGPAIPPVVKNLIIINVIMVVLQQVLFQTQGIQLGDYLGLHYFRSHMFRPWQLISHMFMHGDPRDLNATILHIFSNMFGLWMLGSILEYRWGPKRFLTFYMVCGLGAAACQLGVMSLQLEPIINGYSQFVVNPTLDQFNNFVNHHLHRGADNDIVRPLLKTIRDWNSDPGNTYLPKQALHTARDYVYGVTPLHGAHMDGILDEGMVGASGAVFGILLAFGYLLPNLELFLLFIPIPIKAKYFVLFYMIFELYAGLRANDTDNVAHFAHLGGALFAFIMLKLWGYRFGDRRF
jgi:membrane associated rhomboid family serine protease